MGMAEIIAFKDMKSTAKQREILALFRPSQFHETETCRARKEFTFPSSRPGISGNLGDLFEQVGAVVMRHHEGDPKVPRVVSEKCIELLQAIMEHAEPE
jgi:hypothetical protein